MLESEYKTVSYENTGKGQGKLSFGQNRLRKLQKVTLAVPSGEGGLISDIHVYKKQNKTNKQPLPMKQAACIVYP